MEKKEEKKDGLLSYVSVFLGAIVIAFLIKSFLFTSNLVLGQSMEPSFHPKDRLISLILPLHFSDPNRYDVVILDSPDKKGEEYIKRVIGLPGDTIEISNGIVYLNGEALNETYIDRGVKTETYNEKSWILKEDEYFVMGDNRNPGKSLDSRYFGPIKKDSIRSIVKLRYWPFSKAQIIGGING